MHFIKAILALPFSSFCLAEPLFILHSSYPTLPTPPPEVTGVKEVERWSRSHSESMADAWASYWDADPAKHAHADAMMLDLAATGTWTSKLPEWATATTGSLVLVTETPAWFSELPKDVQSIKLEEGSVWASIMADKTAMAPKETAKAAIGVLAGVAVAAAVL